MTWDPWAGRSVGGGWTRLEGSGPSVDFDPQPAPVHFNRGFIAHELMPADEPAPVVPWVPVPDGPIVGFARDVLGFTLTPRQASILSEFYRDAIRTGVWKLGRRSGKGRMAAIVATFEATANAKKHLACVVPGEQVQIVVVSTSQRNARTVHRYIRAFLQSPALGDVIENDNLDEITLRNGIVVLTVPAFAASARGNAVAVVILDEAAWFQGRDGSPLSVKEVWDALVPATATFPDGKALVLSTPRWASGWFEDMCRQAASGEFADMRTWIATTAEMRPDISASFLASERARDPQMFAREYEAHAASGIGAALPDDLVRAAITDLAARQIVRGWKYVVSIDAAYTGDVFAAASGYRDPLQPGMVSIRQVIGWQGAPGRPLDHREALDNVAAIAKAHNNAPVLLDQFAAEPIAQGLQERGVHVIRRPWTNESKGSAVTVLRELLFAGHLEIPRHPELISELTSLEQTVLSSGRVRFAAPPGLHDDYATAVMALVLHLSGIGATWGGSHSGSAGGIA